MPRPRKHREDKMFKPRLRSSQDEARSKQKAADRLEAAAPPAKSSSRRGRPPHRIMASGKRDPRNTPASKSNGPRDDSDSDIDIPFEKKKDPSRQAEVEDEDDEEEEEEEYAVEKILTHQWKGKKLLFEVKWVGYEETTIEPEENLDGCQEELDAYYKKTGGRPEKASASKATKATAKGAADSRKRSTSAHNDTQTNGRGSKRPKTSSGADATQKFQPPKGSWEDHIIGVETVMRNDQGDLEGLIEWSSGHRSRHPARLLNIKCPQVMLRFYEANLIFTTQDEEAAPAQKRNTDSNGAKPAPPSVSPNDETETATKPLAPLAKMDISDDDDDDDMDTVKAVAHA